MPESKDITIRTKCGGPIVLEMTDTAYAALASVVLTGRVPLRHGGRNAHTALQNAFISWIDSWAAGLEKETDLVTSLMVRPEVPEGYPDPPDPREAEAGKDAWTIDGANVEGAE